MGIAQRIANLGGTPYLLCHPAVVARVEHEITPLITTPVVVVPCDVSKDEDMDRAFATLAEHGKFHGLVHGIAYSDKAGLRGRYVDTTRQNFRDTLDLSCFSLADMARRAEPLIDGGMESGSIVTLTFDGSKGVYQNYNVMGVAKAALEASVRYLAADLGPNIRVNAISASPERTVSARVVGGAENIGDIAKAMSPMGRRATVGDIAGAATFLLSSLSEGVTGDTMMVDCGSSIMNMPLAREANIEALESLTSRLRKNLPPEAPEPIEQDNAPPMIAPGS